jgi:hypothetical protein
VCTIHNRVVEELRCGQNARKTSAECLSDLLVHLVLIDLLEYFNKNLSCYCWVSSHYGHQWHKHVFVINLNIRKFPNTILSVKVYLVFPLLQLATYELRSLHTTNFFLARQMTRHSGFMNKSNLCASCDFHWLVSEIDFLEELRKLIPFPFNRSRSNEAIAILRLSRGLSVFFFSFPFFADSKQFSPSLDTFLKLRLYFMWRLFISFLLLIYSIKTIWERSSCICPESCNQGRWLSLSQCKLR